MTDEHCGNPHCVSCNFKRDHPDDPYHRITCIYAQLLRVTVGAMAEAKQIAEQAAPLYELIEGLTLQKAYNQIIKQRLARVLPDNADDVLAMVSLVGQLLPDRVRENAKKMHLMVIRAEGEEAVAKGQLDGQDEIEAACKLATSYQLDLESVGKQYLSDEAPGMPHTTHHAPGGLQ